MSAELELKLRDLFNSLGIGQGVEGVESAGGVQALDVNLALSAGQPYSMRGYGIYMPRSENPANARLTIDLNGGGLLILQPGMKFLGPFLRFTATRAPGSITTGNARVYVARNPLARLEWDDASVDSGVVPSPAPVVGPSGGATQASGAAAFGVNAPVLATDGVSLTGVKGARALIEVSGGTAFTNAIGAGFVQWWVFDPDGNSGAGRWAPSAVTDNPVQGAASVEVATEDQQVTVPYGRIYAEVYGFTAASAFNVRLQVF